MGKKKKRKHEYEFIRGKRVRVKQPPMLGGMSVEDFIRANADDIWLHENEMHEVLNEKEPKLEKLLDDDDESEVPF